MQRQYDVVQTVELISLSEMKSYISKISPDLTDSDDRESYWEHLLLGWMKFVAPLTSSSVDGVSHLKCVQDALRV
ncbi:hypothetical protein FIBSPDRAFT_853046 [Athelia psychrophila]|uniref:Uncharacterized protein n=1 Tax=Athelia psychrophila TaxID=1759441 RepID=A0A167VJM3_9AGAM|nr:hypothetical protein FIBSPDRAFT_877890 [Fibularhizoctonia sp. CBS 109695]KZP27866.1 hypothetical protein FIBSPDRAFT_853046 [Fibularhizoctonia sp. CBS 109695]